MSGAVMPTGVICHTAQTDTTTPPAGWLFCDGSSQLRATFPSLFTAIGTTYGSVDGTHFNLPDLRGRVMVTKDNSGGSAASRIVNTSNVMGTGGGVETVTLGSSQIPSHTHVTPSHDHVGGTSATFGAVINASAGSTYGILARTNTDASGPLTTDGGTGGNGAHNNMVPFLTINSIIKT